MALRMETGMNDVVLLPIVLISVLFMGGSAHGAGPAPVDSGTIGRSLVGIFLLGPAVGAGIGWAGIIALVRVRDTVGLRRDYESLYALGLAFTAFACAEMLGGSGFVAAFVAGMLVAAQDVELCDCFLEYGEATAEMLLLLTFVALGTLLIWTGIGVIDGPTVLFAIVALVARTVVLYPVLGGLGLSKPDRRLIALLGARGLSSLLLALLPVFAGVDGAERLFSITCLVVLASVVLHGGGIALLLRPRGAAAEPAPAAAGAASGSRAAIELVTAEPETDPEPAGDLPIRMTIEEMDALRAAGEPVTVADVRKDKAFSADPRIAEGAVRLDPVEPVRDARALRLSQHGTLVVYCA